ncbi:LytR/AlgR family response regulator transcription factor [Roseimarinus sediminis]|uniref:LytR/AlgR family response regulator transcription factor n=1 Tax=Roseimarinus sediminis TaxID=1610899 RepID=UPI003D25E2D7
MEAVKKPIKHLLLKPFPQTFLINKPFGGAFTFFFILSAFTIIYRPLEVHQAASLNFYFTVLVYCALITLSEFAAAFIISRTNCFSKKGNWTILNELLSLVMILFTIGISVYFAGFMLEAHSNRWNFSTFFDSFSRSVLIGIIPIIFPSLLNIRYAFAPQNFQRYENKWQDQSKEVPETLIAISSKAKKEHLSFYPSEFIYAESRGNYVLFHLIKQDHAVDVSIRNSMTEIENQLVSNTDFMRIHRAFIVNLKKITSRDGNALGYRLTLKDCDDQISVSRQKAREFEQVMSRK